MIKSIFVISLLFISSLYAQKPVIIVSVDAQKAIVHRISKNKVNIKTLFKDSNFKIKFKRLTLKKLSKADVFFTVGMKIEEKFLNDLKQRNKNLEFYDISKGINKIKMSNGEFNPYVWTDPLNVRIMAKNILNKLIALDPKNEMFYEKNFVKFCEELDSLYLKIKLLFDNTNFSIYVVDDFWDYYIRRFGFREYKYPNRILQANELPTFIEQSKKRDSKIFLVDPKTLRTVERSITINSHAKVIYTNIFKHEWMGRLYKLSEDIKKNMD